MTQRTSDTAGFVLAAPSSGAGKTTAAAAICASLRRKGLAVQPFKVGPDFVDPTYLSLASGRMCANLDGFPNPGLLPYFYSERCRGGEYVPRADIAVVEGVMGLYDGLGAEGLYSTAWTARELGLPVILLVDAQSAATSVAAVVRGFASLDPLVPEIRGVIANRAANQGHAEMIAEALDRFAGIPLIGWLPNVRDASFPSRHLGLIPAAERRDTEEILNRFTILVENGVDLEAILRIARAPTARAATPKISAPPRAGGRARPVRVAVADDDAFCFHYRENWELLEILGAEVIYTSPLTDESVPQGTDLLILPGGYPEEFADQLADNAPYMASVRDFSRRGRIYAECGGMMYLTRAIESRGRSVPMTGVIDAAASMTPSLRRFGYVEARALRDSIMFRRGEDVRAHEFHYSEITGRAPDAFSVRRASGKGDGWTDGFTGGMGADLLTTYLHINFWSCPNAANRLLSSPLR
ncbi:MAG: cobyrinate a,c-diamide synthase [Synergistaceae bacterium]|jgi:cobyrinic acid a,c-diamide synthase|nr:cobyrinate a,c-diamide synthase [Synergistaceae bacterium]